MTDRIVIAGGGLAAARVVHGYRDAGGADALTMISADSHLPYNRPPLSKGFLRGEIEAEAVFVEPDDAYRRYEVDVLLNSVVTRIDPQARIVTLSDGDPLEYDRLVLATGSRPRRLRCPGEHLEGVHVYRTLDDARAVRDAAGSATHALVIGGSFIGMETAASLRRRGLDVTQIELADSLYASLEAPALSRSLERLYRQRGIDVILGDAVAEFRGADGKLTGALTRSGREIPAQLAIVGVGVEPSTAYLDGTGIDSERGTVIVNERFETNLPRIYAVGDIANFTDPVFGHRRVVQHWTNANYQGERLGRCLAGEDAPYDQVAYFFSEVFGVKLGLLGDLDGGHDELLMRGGLEEGQLIGYYLRAGRLVAVLTSGQSAETQAELTALLRRHAVIEDRSLVIDRAAPVAAAFHA
jgi:NADPH-dependent 2,4-dienoyl-CoA reductase/sulfur reductase-like enzyme